MSYNTVLKMKSPGTTIEINSMGIPFNFAILCCVMLLLEEDTSSSMNERTTKKRTSYRKDSKNE